MMMMINAYLGRSQFRGCVDVSDTEGVKADIKRATFKSAFSLAVGAGGEVDNRWAPTSRLSTTEDVGEVGSSRKLTSEPGACMLDVREGEVAIVAPETNNFNKQITIEEKLTEREFNRSRSRHLQNPFESSTREPKRIGNNNITPTTTLTPALTKTQTSATPTTSVTTTASEKATPPSTFKTSTTKQNNNKPATRISSKPRHNRGSLNMKFKHNLEGPLKKMNSAPIWWLILSLLSVLVAFWAATGTQPALLASAASTDRNQSSQQPLGDLVAIGAISLLEPASSTVVSSRPSNRLIDQLTSTRSDVNQQDSNKYNKLDYIVEFMKTNKLTKFCDLLTSQEPEIRKLNDRLNQLDQFTLFVPTNEALLLMKPSGQLEQAKSEPNEMKQFLLAHATSELVVPTLSVTSSQASSQQSRWHNRHQSQQQQQVSAVSTNVVYTLAGSPLRITTVPSVQAAPEKVLLNNGTNNEYRTTKLELIVNGANVISGHSYALQEPNNSSATYAIVHLIDRALYPTPSGTLMDKVRSVAPIMAGYISQAQDAQLNEALESLRHQSTLFVVNDEAFKATPNKLLDQLNSNRSFLVDFLRGHLIDGLYYSGQLTSAGQIVNSDNNRGKLSSLSGMELEFEPKTLQSRTLILVNSIPITDPDLMTLNGVAHLITRPIFERHLLEACHCGSNNKSQTESTEAAIYEKLWPKRAEEVNNRRQSGVVYELDPQATVRSQSSNDNIDWSRQSKPVVESSPLGNELEREESQTQQQQANLVLKSRSQRSGQIVGRNNRDFYRPSAAPANLLLTGVLQPPDDFKRMLNTVSDASNNSTQSTTNTLRRPEEVTQQPTLASAGAEMFDVDRYKVVLNATSRQRMREQLRDTSITNPQANPQFAYDKPLTGSSVGSDLTPTEPSINKRMYSDISPSLNLSSLWQRDQLAVSNTDRQQRVLKFQAEDARDPLPGTRISAHNNLTLQRYPASSNMQPAYDIFGASQNQNSQTLAQQQQALGKTIAPAGSSGCAFYDTECKRLLGRLVKLPAIKGANSKSAQKGLTESASLNNTRRLHPEQHLDSTFGESTEAPPQSNWNQASASVLQQAKSSLMAKQPQQTFNRINSARVSPLNQPLPPWSEEEHRSGQPLSPSWRAQDGDIPRIGGSKLSLMQPGVGFTGGLSRETSKQASNQQSSQVNQAPTTQILLVPVKVLHESMMPSLVSNLTAIAQQQQQFNQNRPLYVPVNQSATSRAPTPSVAFNSNLQYHTPTPYSVSPVTTHTPAMFSNNLNNSPLGRLTNFTAFESSAYDGFDTNVNNRNNNFRSSLQHKAKNLKAQQEQQGAQVPRAPSAHRKQHLQQIQIDNNGSFGANFELNPSSGEKQARKIVRLQSGPNVKSGFISPMNTADYFNNGDILITSAKLTNSSSPTYSNLAEGLASHASNQALNVSANFVRSAPPNVLSASMLDSQQQQSADFFQNRTIAEIMDDSGLRIDNQQVTFNRLKDCLTDAELLSLITQTGNALTIFMPTDTAFQRLVQQQAVAHQRDRQSNQLSRLSVSARLLDPSRRSLLPLVVRKNATTSSSANLLLDNTSNSDQFSATSAADRLTLDCSSNQVRQLLLDHLSARLVTPKQLQTDMGITSLSGHQLLLSSVPSKKIVVVDGQPVIAATRAKNGMVYVVNKFLNLTQQVPNVIDLIETQPNLTTFLSYLSFSSLTDRLKREIGPLTILAPTNEAFEQLSSSARQLINSDPAALLDVLRGHIVEGAQFGKLISMRNKLKTMNSDQSIEAKVIKPNVYLLDNQMTSMRLVGTTGNGVVNAIDRLIVPPWLKVSMGAKPPITSSNFLPETNNNLGGAEIESSAGTRSGQSLNLPIINNQPRRFEQPTNRFSGGGSNTFLFAHPSETLNTDPESPNNPSSGFGETSLFASSTTRSPFLRVAANLTGSPNRFGPTSGGNLLDSFSSTSTNANMTKNMRLIEKLANLMQTKKFIKYLFRSKVSESLKPDMNYVILVPTDQAVEKLPKQIIDMLDRDPERLADLVNYHVLDTTFEYINTIPDGQTLNTLNEKDILFNWHRNNTILTASGAVIMGGIQEENIALLIVDRVLYPTPGDILNIISKSPILSNFTSLVRNAGLEQQLTLAGPYTLFAPSDFAFNQLDKSDLEFLQRNKDTARRFLLRHLSQPSIFTSSIALSNTTMTNPVSANLLLSNSTLLQNNSKPQPVPTMTISNSLGEDLTLRQRNDYFSVNDVNFSYADVAATNGVVHVIDGLL